jgi:hypothetical protein
MNKTYVLAEDALKGEIYRRTYLLLRKEGGGWHAAGAAFGLGAGALSVPLALALGAVPLFTGPAATRLTLAAHGGFDYEENTLRWALGTLNVAAVPS